MIKHYDDASFLPEDWDALAAGQPYLCRDFLKFLQSVSEYAMTYHAIFIGDEIDSIFVTFTKKRHNLGMFSKRDFFLKTTLVYIPMSIARPAVVLGKALDEFSDYMRSIKGCKLILNVGKDFVVPGMATGHTCPQCVLNIVWDSFEGYLSSMRSSYRNRYKKAFNRSADFEIRLLPDNSEFSDELYLQYLEVYDSSRMKIERLSKNFFMDNRFKILTASQNGKYKGFAQLFENGEELVFEFVGFDHTDNTRYDTYLRLLLEIVRYAIEHGFKTVDFGQTADDAKLKLGCRYNYLYAAIGHSNRLLNAIMKRVVSRIQYAYITTDFRVFREDNDG